MNQNYRFLSLIILISSLMLYANYSTGEEILENQINIDQSNFCNEDPQYCIARDSIIIDGNNDLVNQARENGWDEGGYSDGSMFSPFVIGGYFFNNTDGVPSITIYNTNYYVTISRNYIDGGNVSNIGILINNANNVRIIFNNITNLHSSEGSEPSIGIALTSSHNTRIVGNDIHDMESRIIGITLKNSTKNRIVINTIHDVNIGIELLNSSFRNRIYDNEISGAHNMGVHSSSNFNMIYDNLISDCSIGVSANGTKFNRINNNRLVNNLVGVTILNGISPNYLVNNSISHSKLTGVIIENSNFTEINQNYISNTQNGYAVTIHSGNGTNMVWNSFTDNIFFQSQINDNGTFSLIHHNFYSDWSSPDNDFDNFVDLPYNFSGVANNYDPFPLVVPNYLTEFEVISPSFGATVSGSVWIEWVPAKDTYGHHFIYNIFYSSDGGYTWNMIANDVEGSLYIWDSTMVDDSYSSVIMVIAVGENNVGFSRYSARQFEIQNEINEPSKGQIWLETNPSWGESYEGDIIQFETLLTSTLDRDLFNMKFQVEVLDPRGDPYITIEYYLQLFEGSTMGTYFEIQFWELGEYTIIIRVFDDLDREYSTSFLWYVIESYTVTTNNGVINSNRDEESTTPNLELYSIPFSLILPTLFLINFLISYRKKPPS